MNNNETREQTEAKLEYFKAQMNDQQLRLLTAFARGLLRKE